MIVEEIIIAIGCAQGFGFLEPYDGNTKGLSFDTSKTLHFLGQHTFSAGYTWQFPIYDDITTFSGGKFALPSANATGSVPGYLNATNPTVAGALSNAALSLQLAGTVDPGPNVNVDPSLGDPTDTTCTLCPYMWFQAIPRQCLCYCSNHADGLTAVLPGALESTTLPM